MLTVFNKTILVEDCNHEHGTVDSFRNGLLDDALFFDTVEEHDLAGMLAYHGEDDEK